MSRLRTWLERSREVMSINRRNAEFIHVLNDRSDYPIADDKLLTKEALGKAEVPTSPTLDTFRSFYELSGVGQRLGPHDEFVIKPAHGRAGGGIWIITGRRDEGFTTTGGETVGLPAIRQHLADIIFGVYSLDMEDAAVIEPRLKPHAFFERLYPDGLADVRVILVRDEPVASMIRLPTRESSGRANLHQGAVGLGLDLATGEVTRAWHRRRSIATHPDTGAALLGIQVPDFGRIVDIARRASKAVPLGYLGVDIVVDKDIGPLVLEINARPGIEIQNVTGVPLLRRIAEMAARP